MWGFQVSCHCQGFPKFAAEVNLRDALVDSGEPHHRLGCPDCEGEQIWRNPQLANHPSGYWWDYRQAGVKGQLHQCKGVQVGNQKDKNQRRYSLPWSNSEGVGTH